MKCATTVLAPKSCLRNLRTFINKLHDHFQKNKSETQKL